MAEDKELGYLTDDEAMFAVLAQDNFIMLKKQLNFSLGVNENIIFTELLSKYRYYKARNMLTEDGYFFCTAPDLLASTSLTERQQITSIDKLCKKGLIAKEIKGIPARRHFKITATSKLILSLVKEGEKILNVLVAQVKENNETKVEKRKKQQDEVEQQNGDTCTDKKSELEQIKASGDIEQELSTDEDKKSAPSTDKMLELVPTKVQDWCQQDVGTGTDKNAGLVPTLLKPNKTISNNTNNNIIEKEKEINSPSSFSSIELWNKVINTIKLNTNVQEVTFNTWIKPLGIKAHNEHSITLLAPNEFTQGILKARFIDQIIKPAVKVAVGCNMDIQIEVGNLEEAM